MMPRMPFRRWLLWYSVGVAVVVPTVVLAISVCADPRVGRMMELVTDPLFWGLVVSAWFFGWLWYPLAIVLGAPWRKVGNRNDTRPADRGESGG